MNKNKIIIILLTVLCVCGGIFAANAADGILPALNRETQATADSAEASAESEAQQKNGSHEDNSAPESESGADEKDNTENAGNGTTQGKETTSGSSSTAQQGQAELPKSNAAEEQQPENSRITVTISVTCKNALAYAENLPDRDKNKKQELTEKLPQSGYILQSTKYTAAQGETVFDVLSAVCAENGVALEYQTKSYIQGIGGLKTFDCGGSSGWMYRVNGTSPSKGASKYTLSDGDVIEWYYVTGPGDN